MKRLEHLRVSDAHAMNSKKTDSKSRLLARQCQDGFIQMKQDAFSVQDQRGAVEAPTIWTVMDKAAERLGQEAATDTLIPVSLALTGVSCSHARVCCGETVAGARSHVAALLGKSTVQVVLMQRPATSDEPRTLDDEDVLNDQPLDVLVTDFPMVLLRHNEGHGRVFFAADAERAQNGEFLAYIRTPASVQLLEQDPTGRGGWATIRYERDSYHCIRDLPTEVCVRQAHIGNFRENHVRCTSLPVAVAAGPLLVIRHCDGRPTVAFYKRPSAAGVREEPMGFLLSGCTVTWGPPDATCDDKWCQVPFEGQAVWVHRAHVFSAPPGALMHDDTVVISHENGRPDVVYHKTIEAAEACRTSHGRVPSGSLSTLLRWDSRGPQGWAKVSWREGREIYVRQAHVKLAGEPGTPLRRSHRNPL